MAKKPALVLLVEDEPNHVELLTREGTKFGVELKVFRSGEAALAYLFRKGEFCDPDLSPRPRLILLDIKLTKGGGEMDGFDVLRELKTNPEARQTGLHSIPVVILTSSDHDSDMAAAYDGYVNSYLVKPGEWSGWETIMAEVEKYWIELNREPQPA